MPKPKIRPSRIHSFLVHPGKHDAEPEPVRGTTVPKQGRLFDMLAGIYATADEECRVPIRFITDGKQTNEVRGQILALLEKPVRKHFTPLATRLRGVTTGRSGLGLLFLMVGQHGAKHRVVISRFPADEGVLAEPHQRSLRVEFIERIFMRSATAYKAAFYVGTSLKGGFWSGHAVDKQINASHDHLANYWIRDFLASDFRTTAKAGSKRLADALREASQRSPSLLVKQELMSAVILAQGLDGQSVSVSDFLNRFSLSTETRQEVVARFGHHNVVDDTFLFDLSEFQLHVGFRSVELDHGGVMSAASDRFDDCFSREAVNDMDGTVRFTTSGKVVDERLRGRR